MTTIPLSIIIPAYNEGVPIRSTIDAVWRYLARRGAGFEIIVVDDGSTDGTAGIVKDLRTAYPGLTCIENAGNRGKGASVRRGFLQSRGDLVLFSDADLSTPAEEFGNLLAAVEDGADIAAGSRAHKGSRILKRQRACRELMGKSFNLMVRALGMSALRDTQCGCKVFRRETCTRIFLEQRVNRFAFDVELLFLAERAGLKVVEVPVQWINAPASTVRLFPDSARMAFDIIAIRVRQMEGRYSRR